MKNLFVNISGVNSVSTLNKKFPRSLEKLNSSLSKRCANAVSSLQNRLGLPFATLPLYEPGTQEFVCSPDADWMYRRAASCFERKSSLFLDVRECANDLGDHVCCTPMTIRSSFNKKQGCRSEAGFAPKKGDLPFLCQRTDFSSFYPKP